MHIKTILKKKQTTNVPQPVLSIFRPKADLPSDGLDLHHPEVRRDQVQREVQGRDERRSAGSGPPPECRHSHGRPPLQALSLSWSPRV